MTSLRQSTVKSGLIRKNLAEKVRGGGGGGGGGDEANTESQRWK